MSDAIIRVESLSKRYRIGERERYLALRDTLARSLTTPFRWLQTSTTTSSTRTDGFIWALKDVSFDVADGEVIGIIGRNGAGKSTLLKILSRITEPTEGYAEIHGRVGSLLEVGTGFHPELTGRENIYLNGAILGMKKVEISRKFDEIVAFAEVEKFIDTPVKRYSSGMQVRLAFAVAAHLEPEILLVDEVLAVGDVAFQRKCMRKIGEVSRGGRTVLFVSHNMEAVRKLCSRALLLEQGKIDASGETEHILRRYIEVGENLQSLYTIPPPSQNNYPAYAYQLAVEDGNSRPATAIPVGQPWQIRVHLKITQRLEHFMIALGVRTNTGVTLRTSWSVPRTLEPGEYQAVFREETVLLGSGRYHLMLGLSTYERSLQYIEDAGVLEVAEFGEGISLPRVSNSGFILNPFKIEIRKSE
jgi:lipopolysaccharide transport system ATP-binding protein